MTSPANTDPAVIWAYTVRDAFDEGVQDIRADFGLTDLAKAESLAALWELTTGYLASARQDYENRRAAKVAELEGVVPLGPDLPANVSAADAAVLQAAFRAALDEAREADRPGRLAMLQDAQRFGDNLRLRAVLTAAQDDGQSDVVQVWADGHPELTDKLAELVVLRDSALQDGLWVRQAMGAVPKPDEVSYLSGLRKQAEVEAGFEARGLYRRPAGVGSPVARSAQDYMANVTGAAQTRAGSYLAAAAAKYTANASMDAL